MVVQLTQSDAAALPMLRESLVLARSIEDRTALCDAMLGIAGALVELDPERSARWFGAADALAEQMHLVISNPSSRALYARQTQEPATDLDRARLVDLRAAGRDARLDDLLDEDLAGADSRAITWSLQPGRPDTVAR